MYVLNSEGQKCNRKRQKCVSQTEERDIIETKGLRKKCSWGSQGQDNDNGSRYGCTVCLRGRWWGAGKVQRLQKHMRLLTGETLDLLWKYDKNVWDKPDFPKPQHVVRERCCKPEQWNNRKVANIEVNSIFTRDPSTKIRSEDSNIVTNYKNMVSFSRLFI